MVPSGSSSQCCTADPSQVAITSAVPSLPTVPLRQSIACTPTMARPGIAGGPALPGAGGAAVRGRLVDGIAEVTGPEGTGWAPVPGEGVGEALVPEVDAAGWVEPLSEVRLRSAPAVAA